MKDNSRKVAGQNDGTIENCSVSGNVTTGNGLDSDSYVGGITGKNQGTITAYHWSGTVTGDTGIGQGMSNDGDATKVEGSDWTKAMNAMNKALSDEGWLYVASGGDAPLTLQRQN